MVTPYRTWFTMLVVGVTFSVPLLAQAQTCSALQWGCSAYLIGALPSNPQELKDKGVQSIVIDSQNAAGSPSVVQSLRSLGIQPICYVNAFCESRFGSCSGPTMKASDVSSSYNESIPAPNTQFFFSNVARQLNWAKAVGCTVVEIDNIDEYVRRGEVQAVKNLIEVAGTGGFSVVSKNSTNAEVLKMSNVVGAIVEPGSGSASDYRTAFQSAGKGCAGVLMINAGGGDSFTSVTQGNKGGSGEYTQFLGCSATGAVSIPTPPTGPLGALSNLLNAMPQTQPQPTLASLFSPPQQTQSQGIPMNSTSNINPFTSPTQPQTAPQAAAQLVSQLISTLSASSSTSTPLGLFIQNSTQLLSGSQSPTETNPLKDTLRPSTSGQTFAPPSTSLSEPQTSFFSSLLEKIKTVLISLLSLVQR